MFWIIALLITLFVLIVLLWPFIRPNSGGDELIAIERQEQNILIGRYKLAELKQDFAESKLDEKEYQLLKAELESDLHEDLSFAADKQATESTSTRSRLVMFGIIAFVPLAALGMYSWLGSPDAIILSSSPNANRQEPTHEEKLKSITDMTLELEKRLKQNPDNLRGWLMLGRTGMATSQYDKAVKGYKKALALSPEDPSIMVNYADALGASNGTNLIGEPEALLKKALALDPNNKVGLWLAGMAANQRKDNKAAVNAWSRLHGMLKGESADKTRLAEMITNAGGLLTPAEPKAPSAPKVATNNAVTVTVSLAEELKDKVVPSDIVFVYAKAMSGPPMPLAAARIKVSELPITIILDDSMAMMPQMKISGHKQLIVGARVSKSGTPTAKAGDLWIEKKSVSLGSVLSLMIDSIK